MLPNPGFAYEACSVAKAQQIEMLISLACISKILISQIFCRGWLKVLTLIYYILVNETIKFKCSIARKIQYLYELERKSSLTSARDIDRLFVFANWTKIIVRHLNIQSSSIR